MGKVQLADFVLSINPLFSWTWIGILPVSPHPFPKSQCDGARVAWGLLAHGGQGLQRVWNQLATPCQPWALAPPKQGPLWMLTGCSLNLIACLGSHGASVVKVCWALQPERADERESASHRVTSGSLQHHGLQHTRLPCPSPFSGVCSNSCPLILWCHPTISSSVTPFPSCFQSLPALGSFPMSWLFPSVAKGLELQL